MPFLLTMPKLSPTMEEGTVAKWHKKEGEFTEAGSLLLEITTDKATLEYHALDEGWLRKILVPLGQTARVNQPLAVFTETAEEPFELPSPPPSPSPAVTPSSEEPSLVSSVPLSTTLPLPTFSPEPPLPPSYLPPRPAHPPASPLARRLAKEQGLDLKTVRGSGPGGRITSRDLYQAQPTGIVTFGRKEEPTLPGGSYEEIPLTPMRKTIGKRLQEAKSFIPHFYVTKTLDASPLVALRSQLKALHLSVSINDLVIRACALALRKHPEVNRGFHAAHQALIQFQTIDISVAVSLEEGLITPILRHADFKNVGEIHTEMQALVARARDGKLEPHEYKGGSFCVSNLGMYGISHFCAVLNPPQAAILAVGGIEEKPVVREGQIQVGKTLTLTLSADHRVIDGALAAQFLATLDHLLVHPASLLL